jgi:L-lactate utilization protein LutB
MQVSAKKDFYRNLGSTMIERFKKRGMEAYYCDSSEEARELVLGLIPKGAAVSCGDSQTLAQTGIKDALVSGDYDFTDFRGPSPSTPEEQIGRAHV